MADRFHAPTVAALELARSGMEITDAVVNVRARFDLTDADVVSVCTRVDAALAAERKAVAEHEPGLVEGERPRPVVTYAGKPIEGAIVDAGFVSIPARGSDELHAALAPAAGTEERVAERLGLGPIDVTVEVNATPPEVVRAMQTVIDYQLSRLPELGELGDDVEIRSVVSRDEVKRAIAKRRDPAYHRALGAIDKLLPPGRLRPEERRYLADLCAEAAHGVRMVAEAERRGYVELSRDHADDLAVVLARLLVVAVRR